MAFALGPKAANAGYRLSAFDAIGSTNAEALAQAAAGEPGNRWFVTDRQTAGRGRRGRAWETPRGNLAATHLAVLDLPPAVGATLGFVAGLSLDEALRSLLPGLRLATALDWAEAPGEARDETLGRLRLKWPNDVLLDGRKLAGILLEASSLANGRIAIATGIGVNVAAAPSDLPYPAVAIAELGGTVSAEDLFAALSDAWTGYARVWDNGRGFSAIRREWLARAAGLGADVAVSVGGEVFTGIFETIDADGRLVIRAPDGHRREIAAGEVHFGTVATVRA
jgi:BirA family biotin operon repressor/biotin-[acetyl-CoA-carboxylase] ligase